MIGVLSLLGAVACQKNETTPRGAEVLSWLSNGATQQGGTLHEVGPRVSRDVVVHIRPDHKGAVKLAVHVEAGPVDLGEGDRPSRQTAPFAVRAKVIQNVDWSLSARCGDGPHLRLPSLVDGTPVTPEDLLLGCSMSMRYRDSFNDLSYSVALEIGGDGSVKPSIAGGAATLE